MPSGEKQTPQTPTIRHATSFKEEKAKENARASFFASQEGASDLAAVVSAAAAAAKGDKEKREGSHPLEGSQPTPTGRDVPATPRIQTHFESAEEFPRGGSPSGRETAMSLRGAMLTGRMSALSGRSITPLLPRGAFWTAPSPPPLTGASRPSTRTGCRSPATPRQHSPEVARDIDLCAQLSATRSELCRKTGELKDAQAKLGLLDPSKKGQLRRAQEIVLLREVPFGGFTKEDAQFRFVPGCDRQELTLGKKELQPFSIPTEITRKVDRIRERLENEEWDHGVTKRRVIDLEEVINEMERAITKREEALALFSNLGRNVADLHAKRDDAGSHRRLWIEIEKNLRSCGVPFDENKSVMAMSNNPKSPGGGRRRGSTRHAGSKEDDMVGRKLIQVDPDRYVNLWKVVVKFARRCLAPWHRGMRPRQRYLATLFKDFLGTYKDELQSDGSNDTMGVFEFITNCMKVEEFTFRCENLLAHVGASIVGEDTTPIERVMRERYEEAFDSAGGQRLVDECVQMIGGKIRELRQTKPSRGRVTQDCGYAVFGLDGLYKMIETRKEKFYHEVERLAKTTGGFPDIPGLKERHRARQKSLTKYGNDIACLTDILRASITYKGIAEVYNALNTVITEDLRVKRLDFSIIVVEDRFAQPMDGYRDMCILYDIDGIVCEVQLHSHLLMQARKSGGHRAYKRERLITELMYEACMNGNATEIQNIAKEHKTCAPLVRDRNGRSALHYACQQGSLVGARILLQYGANVWAEDERGKLPVELALFHDHYALVDMLLARMYKQTPPTGRPMRRFVEYCVLWLIDTTAYSMTTAMEKGQPDVSTMLQGPWLWMGEKMVDVVKHHVDYGGQKILEGSLFNAAKDGTVPGNLARARVLLTLNFDTPIVAGSESAMDLAIESGHVVMPELLYEFGEKQVQVCKTWICPPNMHLRNASLAENGPKAICALAARADPNHMDAWASCKRTPLMSFAAAGDLDTCKELVKAQAQLAQIDQFRCNAVHYARARGQEQVHTYLMELKNVPNLGLKMNQDICQYVMDAVKGGCCGALISAADAQRKEGTATFQDALGQLIAPYASTLLHMAADAMNDTDPSGQMAKALLALKADPSLKNTKNQTPLHSVAYVGHEEIFNKMLTTLELIGYDLDTIEGEEENVPLVAETRQALYRTLKKKEKAEGKKKEKEGLSKDDKADTIFFLNIGFLGFVHAWRLAQLMAQRQTDAVSFLDVLEERMGGAEGGEAQGSDKGEAGSGGEKSGSGSEHSKGSKSSARSKASRMSGKSAKSAVSRMSAGAKSEGATSTGSGRSSASSTNQSKKEEKLKRKSTRKEGALKPTLELEPMYTSEEGGASPKEKNGKSGKDNWKKVRLAQQTTKALAKTSPKSGGEAPSAKSEGNKTKAEASDKGSEPASSEPASPPVSPRKENRRRSA